MKHIILLILQHPAPTKRPNIIKQICSFQMQVCLSMYELLMETRFYRVKLVIMYNNKTDKLINFSELKFAVKSIFILLYYWQQHYIGCQNICQIWYTCLYIPQDINHSHNTLLLSFFAHHIKKTKTIHDFFRHHQEQQMKTLTFNKLKLWTTVNPEPSRKKHLHTTRY